MNLRQLITFQAVAKTLSFSQAAVSLNYAQSTVSAQIQALESDLNTPLFERLGRQVILTESGKQFLIYTTKMLNLAHEARQAVATPTEPQGKLVISSPETLSIYRLPIVLRTFRAEYPSVQLTFRLSPYKDLARSLREGQMDIAFSLDQPILNPELHVEQLLPEPIVFVAHPTHPLLSNNTLKPADLTHEPILLTEEDCSYRMRLESTLAKSGIRLTSAMTFNSVEAIKQCVIAGIGLTFLPLVVVQKELADGTLVALPWAGDPFIQITQLVWHKDKWLSPALKAFTQKVKYQLGNL